jgi:hypothetical protein
MLFCTVPNLCPMDLPNVTVSTAFTVISSTLNKRDCAKWGVYRKDHVSWVPATGYKYAIQVTKILNSGCTRSVVMEITKPDSHSKLR